MHSDPRPMMSTRRRLLGAAALAGLATPWRLRAAPADSPRLLVVFLRGACDMASLLVPAASDDYLTARPRIAIARPGGGLEAALALGRLGAGPGAGRQPAAALRPRRAGLPALHRHP